MNEKGLKHERKGILILKERNITLAGKSHYQSCSYCSLVIDVRQVSPPH